MKHTRELDQPKEKSSQEGNTKTKDEGTTEGGQEEGVDVSEDYQKMAHEVTHKASKHEIGHLRSKMNAREDDMRKEENKKDKDFSVENGPAGLD